MKEVFHLRSRNDLLITLILAFLYFITGHFSLELLSGQDIVTIGMFIPEGIALGFALYFGKKVWLGIFLGQLFLASINGVHLIATLGVAFTNATEAVIAVIVFEKFKLNKELKTFRDIIGLVILIIFVLQIFSSILSNLFLLLTNQIDQKDFLFSTFSWWFGNVMGQLLITPFLLFLFTRYKKENLGEYLLYTLVFGAFTYFLEVILAIGNPFLLLSITATTLIVIIAKKSIVHATLVNVIIALVTSYSVYLCVGAFHLNSQLDNTINYNLFILTHISIVMVVGMLFQERRKYEDILKETIKVEVKKNKEQELLMLQQNRLAQMGEMISMIAHQWRQPLNNLSLVNQLLLSKYEKNKLDDDAIEYFKINSKKQISIMSTTIDDFRDFFKEEQNKTSFCVNETIKNLLGMTQAIYINGGIHIDFKSQNRYIITGYQNAFSQALLNIINNAKDALMESPVKHKKIEITLQKEDDTITLTIRDNAGGIPEEIIDKIFDPYFSTKKEKNGTGLGLYMSKMILNKQDNMTIEVFNDSEGANFKIYIKETIHAT